MVNNQPSSEEIVSTGNPFIQNNEDDKITQHINTEKAQNASSSTTFDILEILRKAMERSTYDEKLMLLIKFCNDLFFPEALFSQLTLDYVVWRELVQLFMKNNERQIFLTSLEFIDEQNSSEQVIQNFHLIS